MLKNITTDLAAVGWLCFTLIFAAVSAQAQERQTDVTRDRSVTQSNGSLTGVYRINMTESDKLYSVVSGASSNLPFGEQQRFFIDLAVRLTPPDLLAIERRGQTISIASSRAPRITFEADGTTLREQTTGGRFVRTKALLSGNRLMVDTSGGADDSFSVTFEPLEGGRRLRVTRRLYAAQLTEPVVVRSIYDKISEVALWEVYGEPQAVTSGQTAATSPNLKSATVEAGSRRAGELRRALSEWVAATDNRDVRRLVSFYAPHIKAFYLKRDVPRSFVRDERVRAFRQAEEIDVRAEDPEIILREEGSTAIMRFRKRYSTASNGRRQTGEVIQELRWKKTESGWKIFSERDIKVVR